MSTLDLTLRPPPPLDYRQALIVLGVTALIMALAALRFWAVGAWLVIPFLAIDLALLVWAFRASARGSKAYERLRLGGDELMIERVAANGRREDYRLPRAWTRVELDRSRPPLPRLWLRHKQHRLLIGRHLNLREREEVYGIIRRALG
ncbi:MAG: DUF2244 domain-containing protein [Pseudomonadota bacterium]